MMTSVRENAVTNFDSVDAGPISRSPLHSVHEVLGATFEERAGWQVPGVYTSVGEEAKAVRRRCGAADVSAAGILRVRGERARDVLAETFDAVPTNVSDLAVFTADGDIGHIVGLMHDEFLLITRPSTRAEMQSVAQIISDRSGDDRFVTVVDETSGLAGLLVAGPASRTLLSKLCALSFHPEEFPNHHVAQTSLAKVHAVIIRHDANQTPAFAVYVDRPYAIYVWESIIDAGREFGIAPFGWQAREVIAASK